MDIDDSAWTDDDDEEGPGAMQRGVLEIQVYDDRDGSHTGDDDDDDRIDEDLDGEMEVVFEHDEEPVSSDEDGTFHPSDPSDHSNSEQEAEEGEEDTDGDELTAQQMQDFQALLSAEREAERVLARESGGEGTGRMPGSFPSSRVDGGGRAEEDNGEEEEGKTPRSPMCSLSSYDTSNLPNVQEGPHGCLSPPRPCESSAGAEGLSYWCGADSEGDDDDGGEDDEGDDDDEDDDAIGGYGFFNRRRRMTSQFARNGRMKGPAAAAVRGPTSPTARRRASSVSSAKSLLTGAQERVKGLKKPVAGRGKWVDGMVGFGRAWTRGVWGRSGFEEWNRECLPNTNGTIVATYDAPPYIGQHSHDYSFFYTANQAFQLDLYSTQVAPRKDPAEAAGDERQRVTMAGIRARRRALHDFGDDDDDDEPRNDHSIHKIKTVQGVYGQWTVTDADLSRDNEWFSADQKEIVAGASSGQIMVYDVEARQRILNVYGHDDDGDGRYVISNGKDQALRLWDLRQMRSQRDIIHDESASIRYGLRNWDYRNDYYKKPRYEAHPKDCSVMTYRGHHVLKTLIRCHFSPIESTGGQYIYTGGSNGIIYIYALDGRVVQVLDRTKAQPLKTPDGMYTDPSAPSPTPEFNPDPHGNNSCTVRDVSWNGIEPSMISTAWSRDRRGGDLAVHQWKGLGKGGLNRLEDWVEMNEANERG
ncbi:hypothetical protein QFC19_000437 [Naganishia cerealis]|uniref:Uncharacterized protein n=1 Tax=Naganishia cerealis TaxID=610337 RepID=A0ACC2WML7_9TREE|nr:hypothetical protein QFC19_000437 [Naganishia cerealis]